ncbi:MAG: hypothetical protein ABIP75_19080 [Pyrinomonadaceae bacterium]
MTHCFRWLLLFLIFGIGILIVPGQAPSPATKSEPTKNKHLKFKYDKSKDTTTVKLDSMVLADLDRQRKQRGNIPPYVLNIEMTFSYPGKTVVKPVESFDILFRASASNFIFLKGQQIVVALDQGTDQGRALDLGMTGYKSTTEFNSVYAELMKITVTSAALEKIVKANQVDFYLGPDGFGITEKQMQDLRDLYAAMNP